MHLPVFIVFSLEKCSLAVADHRISASFAVYILMIAITVIQGKITAILSDCFRYFAVVCAVCKG